MFVERTCIREYFLLSSSALKYGLVPIVQNWNPRLNDRVWYLPLGYQAVGCGGASWEAEDSLLRPVAVITFKRTRQPRGIFLQSSRTFKTVCDGRRRCYSLSLQDSLIRMAFGVFHSELSEARRR